jgi:hypothetical protein
VGEIFAVVGEEGYLGETTRDDRVSRAEALRELGRQLRPIRVLHDRRCEEVRPPDVVLVHRLEQSLDVRALEAADVRRVVDVARRRSDEDEMREALRLTPRREHADHRAHRVSDEDHVLQLELVADVEHVLYVAVEAGVALRIVGA